jgi:beta-galactosidase
MNTNLQKFAACLGILWCLTGIACADRQRTLIDSGWRFQLGDPNDITNSAETNVAYYPEISNLEKLQSGDVSGPTSETNLMTLRADPVATHLGENVSIVQTNFDDSAWRSLNLPHDWVVELPFSSSADKGHGYKAGISGTTGSNTVGWYRRTFTLPANYAGQTLWVEFDGVYRNCLLWCNGHIVGRNVSGYSSFSFDITQYANPGGTNVLVARVDASRFEGWFYEGAGIYRHVWLVATSPLHVAHWGTFVTNTVTGANASVTVQTQVNNDGASPVTGSLASTILDPDGNIVTTATQSVTVGAGTNQTVSQTMTVTNARLWSLSSPNLYQLISTVTQSGTTNDVYATPFGIRTLSWDPNQGLLLNGQRVEVLGTCNHQDHAGVGTALPDRIQYARVERLKEMGCNALRTSHNSPTPGFLDACDQLGMLVMDENRRLGSDPESLGELQRGILRDRNHPSVFIWSLANEETLQGTTTGATILQAMQALVHQLDPTRLCTVAMNGSWGSGFSTVIDVQGFNYLHQGNEDTYHTSHPTQPLIATEDGSQVGDRGIYTTAGSYVTAYDTFNSSVGWSQTAEAMWQFYSARPYVAGFCDWTGFDYRGEPTPTSWPTISSHFGILDTCGFPKDNFYYFQANWTPKTVLHVFPHWNWSTPGQPVGVWAFSDCDTVELFLNGVSQGMQSVNLQGHVQWSVPYAAGTLEAIGYRNGLPAATNLVATTGSPAAIVLQPDRGTILADGQDVSLVTVEVVDAQGRVVPTASNIVNFAITGGAIIGVGNGNSADQESDKGAQRAVFNGLAQVIVQSTNQTGPITLSATATGLTPASVSITAAAVPPVPVAPGNLTATPGNGVVWFGWDGVPGAISYNVERATTSGGPYTMLASRIPNSYYTDTDVTNGTTYYYVVTATDSGGVSDPSVEASATPTGLPFFTAEPASVTNSAPMYAGVPITFSAATSGVQPVSYQWYEISGGATNAIPGATQAQYTHLAQTGDTGSLGFFVVAGNGFGSVTSSVATLVISKVVAGSPDVISVQFTITNYSGYSGFPLALTNVAGAAAVSNWNAFVITPASGASGTQPGVSMGNLLDRNGVITPATVTVVNASDGWHQTQAITNTDTANARMMNTFWKANPNKSSPSTNRLYVTVTNLLNGSYSAYLYLMQNTGSPIGYVYTGNGTTNYFQEYTKFNSLSNFVTAVDTNGTVNPALNYLRLSRISTGGTNSITFTTVWTSGADGIGVCGVQLIPPVMLAVNPQTNGHFSFHFSAETNQSYVIEASSDLMTWTPVLTNAPTNSVLTYVNSNATAPQLFYRVHP